MRNISKFLRNKWHKMDKTSPSLPLVYRRFALKCSAHNKFYEMKLKFSDKSVQNILAFQSSLEFLQDCLPVQYN